MCLWQVARLFDINSAHDDLDVSLILAELDVSDPNFAKEVKAQVYHICILYDFIILAILRIIFR